LTICKAVIFFEEDKQTLVTQKVPMKMRTDGFVNAIKPKKMCITNVLEPSRLFDDFSSFSRYKVKISKPNAINGRSVPGSEKIGPRNRNRLNTESAE
jgi:hypothetical protein